MALILKYCQLVSLPYGLVRKAHLIRLQSGNSLLKKKNIFSINALLTKEFATPAPLKRSIDLEKSIYQLDVDARYRHKVNRKDIEDILHGIKTSGPVSFAQSLLLLRCCSCLSNTETPKERILLTQKIWSALEKSGLQLNISHYNSLLKVYVENEHKFSVHKFLINLQNNKIKPNAVTYQRLLRACCQAGDIQKSSDILEMMKKEELPVNEDIFNSLVYGHCQANDIKSAEGILEVMKQKGLTPSTETYLLLICAHAKKGEMTEVRRIISECEKNNMVFVDKEYLDIVYALAEGGHQNHIDEILGLAKKKFSYFTHASALVHKETFPFGLSSETEKLKEHLKDVLKRQNLEKISSTHQLSLLHKNMDDIAMKILGTMEIQNAAEDTRTSLVFVIDHFVKCRSVQQILDICETLEEKGYVSQGRNYALKKVLCLDNVPKMLDFLFELRSRNIEVRSHYFWPILICASKTGNSEFVKVLEKMKALNVSRCNLTLSRIIIPNYRWGNNLQKDLDVLKFHQPRPNALNTELLRHFWMNRNIERSEEIAATKPILIASLLRSFHLLINILDESNVTRVVNTLYYLLHDDLEIQQDTSDSSESEGETGEHIEQIESSGIIIEKFVETLAQSNKTHLFIPVLKKMLDKNIPVSSQSADTLRKVCDDPELEGLLQQLTDASLKFQLDENIFQAKNVTNTLKNAAVNNNLQKAQKLHAELGDKATIQDDITLMILELRHNNKEAAMKLCEQLLSKPDENSNTVDQKENDYGSFLIKLAETQDLAAVEKAMEIGIQLNLIEASNFYAKVHALLARNEIEKATDMYCEEVLKHSAAPGYSPLMKTLIEAQKAELLQKVSKAVGVVKGESASLTMLLFQFAELGLTLQAQRLIETEGFKPDRTQFEHLCKKLYEKKSIVGFEILLATTKYVREVNRSILYDRLMNLFGNENNLEKIRALWMQAEEENFPSSQKFINIYSKFFDKNKNVRQEPDSVMDDIKKGNITSALEKCFSTEVRREDIVALFEKLVEQNRIDDCAKLFHILRSSNLIVEVLDNFLKVGRIDFYLRILREKLDANDFKRLDKCLFVPYLSTYVEKDENFLNELRKIVEACAEKGRIFPVVKLFEIYLNFPNYLKDAEDLYDRFLKDQVKTFESTLKYAKKTNRMNVIESILDNQKFISEPEFPLGNFYTSVIEHHTLGNDTEKALLYLNRAVEENRGDLIKKDVLFLLREKLSSVGKNFPYPTLLEQNENGEECMKEG